METREKTNIILNPGLGPVLWLDENTKFIAEAEELFIDSLSMDTVLYFMQFEESQVPSFSILPIADSDNLMLESDDKSIELHFDVNSLLELMSFEVFAEKAGLRRFLIEEDSGVGVFAADYLLVEGMNRIDLDLSLLPGRYRMFTDSLTNMESLGQPGPGLYSMDNLSRPEYESLLIEFDINDTGSSLFCFNWHLKFDYSRCFDRPYAFEVKLDTTTSVHEQDPFALRIFPNPGIGPFKIQTNGIIDRIILFDSMGRKVYEDHEVTGGQFKPNSKLILPGSYFLVVSKDGKSKTVPLIISP